MWLFKESKMMRCHRLLGSITLLRWTAISLTTISNVYFNIATNLSSSRRSCQANLRVAKVNFAFNFIIQSVIEHCCLTALTADTDDRSIFIQALKPLYLWKILKDEYSKWYDFGGMGLMCMSCRPMRSYHFRIMSKQVTCYEYLVRLETYVTDQYLVMSC